jgi:LuxR family transcriptional regulator, maltose regulon positive regulatory protein
VYDQLARANDTAGQALVAARIIEAEHRAYTSLKRFDRWSDVLGTLIDQGLKFQDLESELRIYCSLLLALLLRNPRPPLLQGSVERLCQLVTMNPDPDQMLTAGDVLLRYFDHGGDPHRAQWVIELVNPIVENQAVMPLSRLYWWGRVADFYGHQARFTDALDALTQADRIAKDFVGHPAELVLRNFHVFFCILRGDIAGATEHYARVSQAAPSVTGVGRAMTSLIHFLVAAFTDTVEHALSHNRDALEGFREAGLFFAAINVQIGLAALLAPSAPSNELTALISDIKEEMRDTFMQHHVTELLLVEAYVALRDGQRDHALAFIERALVIRPVSDLYMLRMVPHIFPTTLAFALREKVGEVGIKQWITQFGIRGGLDAPEQWPWPIKIRTLGSFSLAREDRPIVFKGKIPRKPLELLKLLVCAGENGLPTSAVADKLWPNLEADAALNNVDTNVHRLRKVLGVETAIKSSDGRVAIDASQCWVDAWAFEHLANGDKPGIKADDISRGTDALELYRGHFLNDEAEQPWALAYREHLRTRIVPLVQRAGVALQKNGEAPVAAKLYVRALALDNLAEPLYRDLIHCLREQGETSEALKVYRRCREMLSIVLSIEPSKETQALAATLRV